MYIFPHICKIWIEQISKSDFLLMAAQIALKSARSLLCLPMVFFSASDSLRSEPESREKIVVQAPAESGQEDDVEGGTSREIDLGDTKERNRDLSQILEREASIRVQRYGGAGSYSTLSIRGSNPNQVNVYLNGIPLNNAVSGEVNLSDLDVASVQSIEIHRGTATMLANPTIGGAVNLKLSDRSCENRVYIRGGSFRTFGAGFFLSDARNFETGSECQPEKEARKESAGEPESQSSSEMSESGEEIEVQPTRQKFRPGRAPGSAGPGDFWFSVGAGGEVSDQDFLFRNENGTPVLNTFDDFDDRRQNAQYRKGTFTGTFGWFALGTRWDLLNDFFYREHGIPGPGSNQTEKTKRKHLRNTTGLSTDTRAAGWDRLRFKSRIYYTELRNHFFDPRQEFSFQFPGSKSRLQQAGIHLMPEIHVPEFYQTFKFLFGNQREIYHEDRRNALDNPLEKIPTRFRNQSSIHFVDEISLLQGALQIEPFLRYERYTDRFNEPATVQDPLMENRIDREFLDPGMRIRGRVYSSDDWKVYLRGAAYRSRRVPLFVELFGESGTIVSNADLKAEDAETFEGGADVEYSGILDASLSLTIFQRNIRDMILFIPNSRFTLRAENVDAAAIKGMETGTNIDYKALKLFVRYTYQEAINQGGLSFSRGKYLPLRPLHDFSGGASYSLGTFTPGFESHYTGAVFQDRSNDFFFYQEPRWQHNVFLEVLILDEKDYALDFSIEVQNILNERTEDVVGYPLPGRSVYATLNYRF